jgi:molybdate transport system substrate-binding protein
VLAAASLKTAFTELGALFRTANPGASVRFSFAGSSDLVAQLQQGAPGDVLATADTATMDRAAADDLLAGAAQPFATNTMMIAVPPGNPAKITAFADLAGEAVIVVVCAPQVPCGAATEQVEANTGVALSPVSEEGSVTDVLGKVSSGQADAGVVYVTDVTAAGEAVQGVAIPADANATSTYPVAVLAGSRDQALAGRFRDLVLSAHGQQVLADAGFGAP